MINNIFRFLVEDFFSFFPLFCQFHLIYFITKSTTKCDRNVIKSFIILEILHISMVWMNNNKKNLWPDSDITFRTTCSCSYCDLFEMRIINLLFFVVNNNNKKKYSRNWIRWWWKPLMNEEEKKKSNATNRLIKFFYDAISILN